MTAVLVRLRPGPAATAWLVGTIRALQAGDPLRPVTVVVPSHHAGLHVRRRLALEGYAGVRFTVLPRLAEALGAARLAGEERAPLTAVTRAALVRAALRAAGGPLARSAEHAGLVDLVARLAGELRRRAAPSDDVTEVRSTGTATARAALDTIAEYERRRAAARLYDEVDLLGAAAASVLDGESEAALTDAGAVVVHLPARLDAPDIAFLRAIAGRVPVTIALADLGEQPQDARPPAGLDGGEAPTVALPAPEPARVSALIASDPVEEVRAAVRGVLAAAERADAVPVHRSAVVYRDEETYAGLLRDTLEEAGLPYVALDGRRLVDSVPARGLLGLVRLREQDFTRPAVLGWLSALPHRTGVLRSQARWDQLSRDAGVVRGAGSWRDQLTTLIEARRRSLARLDSDPEDGAAEARRAALRRDIEDATRIVEHVAAIDEATRPPVEQTWGAHVSWALRLRDEFLAPDSAWSAEDREASQAVEELVGSLAAAGAVEPAVSVGVFLRAIEDGLAARQRPEGRMGGGVIIGPHRLLLGVDVVRVHVLGVVETGFPAALPVDPLLSGDPLGRRDVHEAQERRDWLVALAAADGGEAVVSAPAADLDGRAVYPSPWLLQAIAGDGKPLRASEVRAGTTGHPRVLRVHSADAALASDAPLSVAERREAEAMRTFSAGRDLASSALAGRPDLPLGRALEVMRARRSSSLTAFDGKVSDAADLPAISSGLGGALQSATGVETWATCPFRFLLGRILVVRPTEDADDDGWWRIDRAERGTLVHGILEQFFAAVAATGRPAPGDPYGADDLARVEAIAAIVFGEAEERGVTGHPLVWANERAAILADLRTLLAEDARQRAAGWRPAHLEQAFGLDAVPGSWPAVVIPLADGRPVALRGFIDRVDAGDRGRARVIDYKTGSKRSPAIGAANRFDAGRKLQLPVYGRAVRDRHRAEGRPPPVTTSLYWYATVRGGFGQVTLDVDDACETVLGEVIERIDAGVRAGCFPQVPGEFEEWRGSCENCTYCAYDSVCPASREVVTAAKADDPALAPYRALQPAAGEAAP